MGEEKKSEAGGIACLVHIILRFFLVILVLDQGSMYIAEKLCTVSCVVFYSSPLLIIIDGAFNQSIESNIYYGPRPECNQ